MLSALASTLITVGVIAGGTWLLLQLFPTSYEPEPYYDNDLDPDPDH